MLTLSEQSNKAFRRLVQLAYFERLSICTAIIKLISCDDMDDDGALNIPGGVSALCTDIFLHPEQMGTWNFVQVRWFT